MSYDLYFRTHEKVSIDDLKEYSSALPNFAVSDDRAHYANEGTGVYFGFDFLSEAEDGQAPITFNMNYFRPHVFGAGRYSRRPRLVGPSSGRT